MTNQAAPRDVKLFTSTPLLFLLSAWMWGMSKAGFSWPVLRMMQRAMQSPQNKQRAFQGYGPTAQDVFVCTYSKSGTNWALQIAHQIAHRGAGDFRHIHAVVPWPEAPMPDLIPLRDESVWRAAPTGLRVIKTHLESQYVPYSPAAKYIIIARDPKDVFISSYYFSAALLAPGTMVPVDEWLAAFLSDKFQYGSWAEQLAGYWAWRTRPNVLILNFAAMKAELPSAVKQVATLMGVELTAAELAQVVQQSTFAQMKAIDYKFVPNKPYPFDRLMPGVMMRRGENGVAAELLTPAQQGQIDHYVQAELQRRGCDFPYAATFLA